MADYNLGPFRIRPRGQFDSSSNYKYLDLVTYDGGSYICINLDTIDGVGVIGILPTGDASSESYWQLIATKGEQGDPPDSYNNFITVNNGHWDYSKSDKIFIPNTAPDTLDIINVYNGCCGIILTEKELDLPVNSDYSIDFNYVTIFPNQYYMYTFVYGHCMSLNDKFIWNRTVIEQ